MAKTSASGVSDRLLVAPDSFKGSLTAAEVADAIARGLEAGDLVVDRCPLADGGEGTVAALSDALGLDSKPALVHDPRGRAVTADFGLSPGGIAVVEVAAASGLTLIAAAERDPLLASSYGTGELIAAAVSAGARTVYVAAGGSATTDGGEGALRALLEHGGVRGARVVVLCDVRTPFELAAGVFGAQKGASAQQVKTLTRRLDRLARTFRRDPRGVTMGGAAGGLAGGLWAELGAELLGGAAFVLETVGYNARMRAALAVITGEGCLDHQSLAGKLVGEVATRARQAGVPCHAIVGRNRLSAFQARILDLESVIEAHTLAELVAAGEEIAAALGAQRARGS